jgi:NAD(P)H-dependent FMN reductase
MSSPGDRPTRLLLVCGSLRRGSTNAAVLRVAAEMAPDGLVVDVYERTAALPHFNPDDDVEPLHPEVAELRARLDAADAVLLSTPEYAGALPGAFKNLLDWTVGGTEIDDTKVAWVNCSTAPMGARSAHDSLRTVLRYVGATIVDAACLHLPVPRQAVDGDGRIVDPLLRERIGAAVGRLLQPAPAGRVDAAWAEFEAEAPALAGLAAERLRAAPAYLGTVDSRGGSRVHPVSPIIGGGRLFVFMEPTSPKGRDLRDRGRYALHNGVPDSEGTGGECILRGNASPVDDDALRAVAVGAASYRPADRYVLFELRLEEATITEYEGGAPRRRRWAAA